MPSRNLLAWALVTALCLLLLAAQLEWKLYRARRKLPEEPLEVARHLHRFNSSAFWEWFFGVLVYMLVASYFVPDEPRVLSMAFYTLELTLGFGMFLYLNSCSHRLRGGLMGQGWNRSRYRALEAVVHPPLFGVLWWGAVSALACHLVAVAVGVELPLAVETACVALAIPLMGTARGFQVLGTYGRSGQLPAEVDRELRSSVDARPLPPVHVIPAQGSAFYNAVAAHTRHGPGVWISDALFDVLSPRECVAILWHEVGHLRLRHTKIQGWAMLIAQIAAGVLLVASGLPGFLWAALAWYAIYCLMASWLSQRHELAADAYAAQRLGEGESVAAALGKLYAASFHPHQNPEATSSFDTHPGMGARMEALGVSPPAPDSSAEPEPAPPRSRWRGSWAHNLGLWVVLLLQVLLLVTVLREGDAARSPAPQPPAEWSEPEALP